MTERERQEVTSITWQAGISLRGDQVVAQQLALVIGIPLVLVFALLIALQWPLSWERAGWLLQIMLWVTLFILLLYAFVVFVVYGGKYQMRYTLDEQGVRAQQNGRVVRLLPWVRAALFLSGRPSAMGAGILAQSPGVEALLWKDVEEIEANAARHTLTLHGSNRQQLVMHCNAQNYEEVRRYCEERRGKGGA